MPAVRKYAVSTSRNSASSLSRRGGALHLDGGVDRGAAQRHVVGERDRLHAGHRRDGRRDVAVELERALGARRTSRRGRHRSARPAGGPRRTRCGTRCSRSRLRTRRPGAGEQHQRERDLAHDQRRRGAAAAPARCPAPRALPERADERARAAERRQQPEPHDERDREHHRGRPWPSGSTASSPARGSRSAARDPEPPHEQHRSHRGRARPPRRPSTTHSAASSRSSAPRPPPSAVRMASSRERAPARASARAATLTQAMSSTKTAADGQQPELRPGAAQDLRGHRLERHAPPAAVLRRVGLGQVGGDRGECLHAGRRVHAGAEPADDAAVRVQAPLLERGARVARMAVIGAQRSAQVG